MLWITEQDIDENVLPEPVEIVEEVYWTPEEEFEKFLIELKKRLIKKAFFIYINW